MNKPPVHTVANARDFAPASYPGLEGRTVVCTGAAGGIGRAMAFAFARHGCNLMLLDIDAKAVAECRAEVLERYPRAKVSSFVCSVTDETAVATACAKTVEDLGSLDVLLNTAGISMNKPSLELTGEEWRRAIDIDLSGVWYCSQAAARHMRRLRGGSIINTASMWGVASAPGRVAYCAAKAGVVSMTKVLASEWAEHGIRVNSICPGYTATALTEELARQGRLDDRALMARTPLKRFGRPEEMAEVALYLASDAAAFITGHALVSDGGWTAHGL